MTHFRWLHVSHITVRVALILAALSMFPYTRSGDVHASDIPVPTPGSFVTISMTQAGELMAQHPDWLILDVREPSEYCTAYGGHIPGALNYPYTSEVLYNRYTELPMDRTILIYCRSGNRSRSAASFLAGKGFQSLYDIGGIKDWKGDTITCDQTPPLAEAGNDQDVLEGQTVLLSGVTALDSRGNPAEVFWQQIQGPDVHLSSDSDPEPGFVAPAVTENGATLVFLLTVKDAEGLTSSDQVSIGVADNGVHGFPEDALPFITLSGAGMGVRLTSGYLTALRSTAPDDADDGIDLQSLAVTGEIPYGLINLDLSVDPPGASAGVTLYFPEPVPSRFAWFNRSGTTGWTDATETVSLDSDRTSLSITLADGGPGDDDGMADGTLTSWVCLVVLPDTSSEDPEPPVTVPPDDTIDPEPNEPDEEDEPEVPPVPDPPADPQPDVSNPDDTGTSGDEPESQGGGGGGCFIFLLENTFR